MIAIEKGLFRRLRTFSKNFPVEINGPISIKFYTQPTEKEGRKFNIGFGSQILKYTYFLSETTWPGCMTYAATRQSGEKMYIHIFGLDHMTKMAHALIW